MWFGELRNRRFGGFVNNKNFGIRTQEFWAILSALELMNWKLHRTGLFRLIADELLIIRKVQRELTLRP